MYDFKEGDDVIHFRDGFGGFVKKAKIFKKYKNGNVILQPNGTQFRGNTGFSTHKFGGSYIKPFNLEEYKKMREPYEQAFYIQAINSEAAKCDIGTLASVLQILKNSSEKKA